MNDNFRFGGKPGEPVPEVDPEDLKAVWELGRIAQRESPGEKGAIGRNLIEHACKSNADIQAVSYRASMLSLLSFVVPDRLAPWMKEGQPGDALFQEAAKFPLQWMGVGVVRQRFPFDVDEFFRRVSEEQGGTA